MRYRLASGARILGDHDVFGGAALWLAQPHSSFVMPSEVLQQRIPGRTGGMRVMDGSATRIDPAMPATFVESVDNANPVSVTPISCIEHGSGWRATG